MGTQAGRDFFTKAMDAAYLINQMIKISEAAPYVMQDSDLAIDLQKMYDRLINIDADR